MYQLRDWLECFGPYPAEGRAEPNLLGLFDRTHTCYWCLPEDKWQDCIETVQMIDRAAILKLTVMHLHQKHLEINYTVRFPSVWRQTVSAYSFKPELPYYVTQWWNIFFLYSS